MLGNFIRENRDGIRIGLGIVLMIAGLVAMILSHFLPGLLVFFVGLVCLTSVLSGILVSSGYASGEEAVSPGIKGQGRNTSAKNHNHHNNTLRHHQT